MKTLIKILCLCLLWVSCDNSTEPENIYGCTDDTMFNYNADATQDDGSCVEVVEGCMDSTMFNYSPLANINDSSCIPFVYGCTDSTACNYDSLASFDDGSCVYPGQIYQNNITICIGQTYVIGGNIYDSSGTYVDSLTNSFGCDSIIYTNLTMYSQFNNPISGGIDNNTVGGGGFYLSLIHI